MPPKKENLTSKISFLVLFVLVIVMAFKIVASFLLALVVGGLFALALHPFQKKLIAKKISPKLSAYLVFTILVVAVVVPLGFFVRSLILQALAFKEYVSSSDISYSSILQAIGQWPLVGRLIPDPSELSVHIKTWIVDLGTLISTSALNEAARIPTLLIQTFFGLLSCLFFLLDGKKFSGFLYDKIPVREDIKIAVISTFKKSSRSAIWASLLAAVSQSVVMFLGFITLNIPAAFLAAGATFVFAFIPFVGSVPVWLSAVIYLYLKGSITKCIIMVVFGIISSLIDNLVRIYVLKGSKDSQGLHPLISLVAVLGGIEIFGFFGVIIGPVILTLLISMLEVWPSVFKEGQ